MKRTDRRKKRLLALGLIVTTVAAAFGAMYWVQAQTRAALLPAARTDGMAAYQRGDYEEALPHFAYVASRDPSDVEVLLTFASARSKIALENDRHLTEAIALCLAALHYEPRNLRGLEQLLRLYERTARRLEWSETADRILAIEPNHVEALRLRAAAHAVVSEFDSALHATQRLIDIQPNDLRWRLFHLQLHHDAETPRHDILAMCDAWIDEATPADSVHSTPGWYAADGRFHLIKATYLASIGELEEAKEVALLAAERGAEMPDVLSRLASLLDALQLRTEAAALIEHTKDLHPAETWPHETSVRRLWQTGHINAALNEIEEVQRLGVDLSSELLRWKSLLLIHHNELDEARQVLALLESRYAKPQYDAEPESRDAHRAWIEAVRARIELDNRNWSESLNAYRNAIALNPEDALLHFLLGEALSRVGEYELATASLEQAVRSDPNWVAAQVRLAESLLRTGRSDTAARMLSQLIRRLEAPTLDLYILFARCWVASGLTSDELGILGPPPDRQAIEPEHFLRVLRDYAPDRSPQRVEVTNLLLQKLLHEGEEESAGEVIEEILAEESADPSMLIEAARSSEFAQLGFEERLINRAVAQIGMTPEIAEVKARILHRQGETERGRMLLEDTVNNAERGSIAHTMSRRALASYLARIAHPQAVEVLDAILQDASENPDGHMEDVAFVLSQPLAWSHVELAARGLDLLEGSLGASSLRAGLARATYILHFERESAASMAHALVLVNDILQVTPDSLGARALMAALHVAAEPPDYDEATRHLRRAVRSHPRRVDLYPQLIALLQQQGDFATAETYLARLHALAGRRDNLRRTELRLLEAQGNFHAIISLLGERLAGASSEADRITLLTAYHRSGRRDHADNIADSLLEMTELSAESLSVIAQFYADTGRADEGLAMLMEADARPSVSSAERALFLGSYHQYIGRTEDAERWLLQAAQFDPADARIWNSLVDHYLRLGDFREARRAARSGMNALSPGSAEHDELLSKLLLASLNLDENARHEAQQLLNALSSDHNPLTETVRLYSRITTRANATPTTQDLADANQLVRVHGHYLPAWRLAIAAHAHANRLDAAADIARRAAARFPNHPEPAQQAAKILIALNRPAEALEMAQTWRSRSLDRLLEPDAVIAALLIDLDRARAAADQLAQHEKRILAEQARPEHLRTLLTAYTLGGKHDRALAIVRSQTDHEPWSELMVSLAARTPVEIAERLLDTLEPQFEGNPRGNLLLAAQWGELAMRSEQSHHFERAQRLANEAIDTHETRLQARLLLGSLTEHRQDLIAAESHYRAALALDPDNVIALNNLAYVLAQRSETGHADEAVELSQRALTVMPDHPDILDTHAQALLAAGRADAARSHADRALAQRPDDPIALLTLTRVLIAQDRMDEAKHAFQRASSVISSSQTTQTRVRTTQREVEQALLAMHVKPGT